MEGGALFGVLFCCYGIFLSLGKSVSNDCGTLSYPEPAIAKRNVTLTFKPINVTQGQTVTWSIGNYNITESSKYRLEYLDTYFTLIINTTLADRTKELKVLYGACRSETIRFNLTVIHNCGLLYKRTPNARRGDTMELGYFPTMNMVNFESRYARIFSVTNSTCTAPHGCHVTNVTGVYEIWSVGYNHEYVLSIVLQEEYVNGRYRLQCTTGRENTTAGNVFTDFIDVRMPVPPNQPKFLNTTAIDGCSSCLVGIVDQRINVTCNVSGGIPLPDVNIYVGNKSMGVVSDGDGVYVASVMITEVRHLEDARCTATNLALDTPLVTPAKIYTAVTPKDPVIITNNVREGVSSSYPTCTSREARPPSNVTLQNQNGSYVEVTINRTEDMSHRYTTSVTATHLSKEWNLQNLTCCSSHFTYNDGVKCVRQQLEYKFSPDSVEIQLADNYTQLLPSYNYTLTCAIARAYPACSAVLTLPEGVDEMGTSNTTDGTGVVTTTSTLSLNVSKKDIRKLVTCTANCTDVGSNMSDRHVIEVLFSPDSVDIQLADDYTQVLPSYNYTITCVIARAYPACSAVWTLPKGVDILGTSNTTNDTGVVTTRSSLSLNVSVEDNRKQITCTADCSGRSVNMSDSHVITVPYVPVILFNVTWPELIMTEDDTIVVMCTASWATGVRWLDPGNRTTAPGHSDCGPGAACLSLGPVSKQDGRRYTCNAHNELHNNSMSIDIKVKGHPIQDRSAQSGGDSLTIIVISSVCIVVLVACIAAVVFLKRRKSPKSVSRHEPSEKSKSGPENHPENREENDRQVFENGAYDTEEPVPEPVQVQVETNSVQTCGRGEAQKELIYADLDLGEAPRSQAGTVIIRGENETEYVDIDFSKKAEPLPDSDVEVETENVYMNQ